LDIILLGGKYPKAIRKKRNKKGRKRRREEKKEKIKRRLETKKANREIKTQQLRKSQQEEKEAKISNSSIEPEKLTVMETRSKSHSKISEEQFKGSTEKEGSEKRIGPYNFEGMNGCSVYHRQTKEDQIYGALIKINNKTLTYFFRYYEGQKAFSIYNDISRRCNWNINRIKVFWDRGKEVESQIPIIF
jgi:hypothetical protein